MASNKRRQAEYRFGAALAKIVEEYGLRQDLLAQSVGMTESSFSNIKNQKVGIGFEKAMAIAEALPEKARLDLYAELFTLPEVWVSNSGKCRKPGAHRIQSDIGDYVQELKTGQFVVLRKMPPLIPERTKSRKASSKCLSDAVSERPIAKPRTIA